MQNLPDIREVVKDLKEKGKHLIKIDKNMNQQSTEKQYKSLSRLKGDTCPQSKLGKLTLRLH